MNNITFSTAIMALLLFSCNEKSNESTNDQTYKMNNGSHMMDNDSTVMHNKSNTMQNHEELFSCPMHPEVIGKKNEKCSKCGMKLTEPVVE